MGNEDKSVEKVEVRRMTGLPVLTEVDGVFERRELGSISRRTVVYDLVGILGLKTKIPLRNPPKPHYNVRTKPKFDGFA